jgi:uncharacterized protein
MNLRTEPKQDIIRKTIDFVKEMQNNFDPGHDYSHSLRVYNLSKRIAISENVKDTFLIEIGALLHDIADSKFYKGDELVGPKKAREFLKNHGLDDDFIKEIELIIKNISFKGGNFKQEYKSLELDIIQDADRLDAIGAIGIARTFSYGGFNKLRMYDSKVKPNLNMTKEEYKNSESITINHFYEKLLLLKDRMNTKTGKEIAKKRHDFMLKFLEEFFEEVEFSYE